MANGHDPVSDVGARDAVGAVPPGGAAGAVGVIGIGNMGLPIALRLRDRGYAVAARDLVPDREAEAARHGATVCASPAAVAGRSRVIVVAVVDASQCDDVLFGRAGAAAALPAGAAVVLCPTISPGDTERIASRLAGHGIDCVDAPMSGGPARARDGSISLMVACADAAFERHRALLDAMSSKLFRIGTRPGDGARTKLVNNLLAAINLGGAAEAIALAEKLGLDAATTLAVIEQSSGQSWIGSDRMRRALAGDTVPRAHTTLLAKDSRLAIEAARSVGFDAAIGAAAMRVFAAAGASERYAELDDSSLLAYLRASP